MFIISAKPFSSSYTKNLPVIAVLVPISTSNISDASNETLPLFTLLLPSLVLSVDCGFHYLVVVGFNDHDEFFDTEQVRGAVLS